MTAITTPAHGRRPPGGTTIDSGAAPRRADDRRRGLLRVTLGTLRGGIVNRPGQCAALERTRALLARMRAR